MNELSPRIQALESELARLRAEQEGQRRPQTFDDPEHLLRTLMDQAPDQIYFKDLQSRFIWANRAVARSFRLEDPASLPGKSDFDFFSQEHAERAYANEQEIIRTGVPKIGMEEKETWPDGSITWVSTTKVPFRDAEGNMRGTFGISRDITARKQAETAFRLDDDKFRIAFEHAGDGLLIGSSDGLIINANANACEMTGLAREELLGTHISRLFPESVLAKAPLRFDQLQEGQRVISERDLRRKDGGSLPIEMNTKMMQDGTYYAILRDLSAGKEAEKALRASETCFHSLLDRLNEGFAIDDPEERWTFANPAAARIFGVAPGSLAGRTFREFVDDDTYQEILRQTARRRRGESSTYEVEISRPDGEKRYVLLTASPHMDEHGEYLGAEGLFVDVTERRLAENALRESQARYLELFNNTTDAIFWILVGSDGTFSIESFNPAEAARLGRTCGELAGKAFHEFLPREFADPVVANFQRCLAAGCPIRYEETVEMGQGAMTFQTLLIPIRDGGGRITRIVGFSQDVTQNKQTEEALRQAQKLESLGILAGGIAHDFNNLLTAMLGNLNLAQLTSSPESQILPYLDNIERTILKAAELTKQMLAYSGRGRFVVKPHDLNQVVREMTHLLSVSISKKVAIRYDLAEELPPIEADVAQLQQVVMNLVTNASEAIGDQEGVIGIATRTYGLDNDMLRSAFANQDLKSGTYVSLEISDTGGGIAPGIREKIFDPFFTTKQSGRGLGLCAMQGILRGHRAGIQIASVPGKGTTFTLLFPLARNVAVATAPTSAGSGEVPRGRRILLVDDESDVREATAGMLGALGFQVVTAVDGQDALERFTAEKGSFDLVLLDLTMPRMDGRETCRELKRIRADVPVILCSGYSEHDTLPENMTQGFAGFLPKPFLMDDLRKALQQVP